jgi:hypothetical protein
MHAPEHEDFSSTAGSSSRPLYTARDDDDLDPPLSAIGTRIHRGIEHR